MYGVYILALQDNEREKMEVLREIKGFILKC